MWAFTHLEKLEFIKSIFFYSHKNALSDFWAITSSNYSINFQLGSESKEVNPSFNVVFLLLFAFDRSFYHFPTF